MEDKDIGLLNREDLIKSLQDLEFSPDEITDIVSKAEKEGKFEAGETKEEEKETETIDEAKADAAEDKDDMKKAFDKIMDMKASIDKSMAEFLDMFGKVPGMTTPTDFTKKSEEDELKKAEEANIEKAFGDKFGTIEKSIQSFVESQATINEKITKALDEVALDIKKVAEAPNPLKGIFGNYKGNILEKGEKVNEQGKTVVSLRNKEQVEGLFEKAINKSDNEEDKKFMRSALADNSISNKIQNTGFDIVKKALEIDFEK